MPFSKKSQKKYVINILGQSLKSMSYLIHVNTQNSSKTVGKSFKTYIDLCGRNGWLSHEKIYSVCTLELFSKEFYKRCFINQPYI